MNFPPLFRSLHSSLFIAFHYLPSPFITFYRLSSSFITFHYLSSPPHLIVRPLSALPRFVLTSPRFVLPSPRSLTMPPHSPASHLLPSCFITPFVSHIRLSRTIVCAPFFYSLCFTHSIVFTLSHCFTSFVLLPPPLLYSLHCFTPLCFAHSIVLHRFALLSPIVYPPFALFTHIVLHPFFTPRQPPQTRPRHRKRQRFSHFSKKFCKSP